MYNPIKTDDMAEIRGELQRRGVTEVDDPLPNRTFAFPTTRELFYVQDDPPLAAWAAYRTEADFIECFNKLTAKAMTAQNVRVSVKETIGFGGPTDLVLCNLPYER